MDNILIIKHLSKSFDTLKAVNDISFEVKRGSLFAFLGQNGAGKSTTIKMITTLLRKDTGEILLNDSSDEAYFREKIGVVFQENVLDGLLTVKENLMLRGAFYLKDKIKVFERYESLINKLHLKEIENQVFYTLSGGQKRRVEIARALFSNPELLILDEPTTGLDPETRLVVWDLINKLRVEEGVTVLLTTHYMEEANNADYVVIINKGSIVAKGTPSELKEIHSKDYFRIVPFHKEDLVNYLNSNQRAFVKKSDVYFVEIKNTKDAIDLIVDLKENIRNFEVVNGTLDDVFVKIVGEHNV